MNPEPKVPTAPNTISYQTVVTTTPPPLPDMPANNSKRLSRKAVGALLSIVVLVAGVITSIVLVQRQQQVSIGAWDCNKYNFTVSISGQVKVENTSPNTEQEQQVSIVVKVNGVDQASTILTVPTLPAGQSANLGSVNVPSGGGFSWTAQGSKDCQDSGTYPVIETANCKVQFDESDKLYCATNPGRVTVTGTIVSAPAGSTLEKSWYTVHPTRTETQYSSEPAQTGKKFSISTDWPGIKSGNSVVEIHFGFNMRDANGNLIANCNGGLDYWWNKENANSCQGVTPTTTPRPTNTPRPSPTATPTPKLVCNTTCTTNTQCDTNYCYKVNGASSGSCRNQNAPTNTQCIVPGITNTPIPPTTTPQPTNTPIPPTNTPVPTTPPGQPTNTPGPTSPPTSSNPNSCNGTCGSNANCNPGLVCYLGYCRNQDNPTDTACTGKTLASCNGFCNNTADCSSGLTCLSGKCRNAQNPDNSSCANKTIATGGSNPAPTPVTTLPKSGAADYTLGLGLGGLLLLGLGALLAL